MGGKFLNWIKRPENCTCVNQTDQMERYGKDVFNIVNSRSRIISNTTGNKCTTVVYEKMELFWKNLWEDRTFTKDRTSVEKKNVCGKTELCGNTELVWIVLCILF